MILTCQYKISILTCHINNRRDILGTLDLMTLDTSNNFRDPNLFSKFEDLLTLHCKFKGCSCISLFLQRKSLILNCRNIMN